MKILLADDAAASRYLLQRAVEALGHQCEVAEDGLEAWERFQSSPSEVVISDWMMPGIDGDELCRRIRQDPAAPYTYFIMLTSLEDKQHVLKGMEAGADDYLTKPLDPHDLKMRLIAASRVTMLHRRLLAQQHLIEGEVELAAGIQRGLFPARPPNVQGLALAGRCVPAANVGGDYYDYVEDLGGRVTVLVADVAGHSIGSALMVAMARSLLRREIAEGSGPAAVLRSTNEAMFRDLVNAELFITMFCARFDPARQTLRYANAGHNPPLLSRAGEAVSELDAEGAAVGFFERLEFEEVAMDLGTGDSVTLYTDGIVEALDPGGEQFGEDRLRELVSDAPSIPPEDMATRVLEAVRTHTRDAPPQDDMTLVGLQVLGR